MHSWFKSISFCAAAMCLVCAVPRAQAGLIDSDAPRIQDDTQNNNAIAIPAHDLRVSEREWETSTFDGIDEDRVQRMAAGLTPASAAAVPQHGAPVTTSGRHEAHSLQLPAGPSSLSLLLSAALSVGAWHCGRFAHRGIGAIVRAPDWYHTGGPVQVSETTPWDASSIDAPIATCLQPTLEFEAATPQHIGAEVSRLLYDRLFTIVLPHRGPPISD